MERSRSFYFLLVAMLVFGLASGQLVPISHASSNSNLKSGYTFNQTVNFNPYGQFYMNETIKQDVNSSLGLSFVTIGFPPVYQGHTVDVNATVSSGGSETIVPVTQTSTSKTLNMTLNFPSPLPPGRNATINLGFFVVSVYKVYNASYYYIPTTLVPSLSIRVDKLSSYLIFPYSDLSVANASIQTPSPGFSQTVSSATQLWNLTSVNSTTPALSWGTLAVSSFTSSATGNIVFQNLTRVISVSPSGQPIVTEYIHIDNLGLNRLTSLNYGLLMNETFPEYNITVIPPSDPLLSNEQTATNLWTGGALSLTSGAINNPVSANSSYSLIVRYPLGPEYWNVTNGVYHVQIPNSLPVGALVENYRLEILIPHGIVVTESTGSVQAYNVWRPQPDVILVYRQGIGSALGDWVPVASLAFIAVFLLGIVFRQTKGVSETVLESSAEDLVKAAEEKVSGTNEILSELRARGASATRNDLVTSRSRIDEVRAKFSNRVGVLRSQLATTRPSAQSDLALLTANDREYDRAVRDSLNTYDQFISRRMKQDAFDRLRVNNERRVQKTANDLLDSVQSVRRTYEE